MKYSVIIPVYNAEKTLRRCVDSLLTQNCSDAEIILVNDGSRDNSGGICEEYARNNRNVRCISQLNGGVSSARNAGLDAAQGEFVLFVDSDDYVTPEFFSSIVNETGSNCADLIQFSGCVDNGTKKLVYHRKAITAKTRDELFPIIISSLCRKTINGPCAKLYKRVIIEKHHIRFPLGVSVAEDRVFNIVYSFYIRSYSVSDQEVYVINTENENSLSRKRHTDLKEQFEKADDYFDRELACAPIPDREKESYRRAFDFGRCRVIYHDAKLMIQDRIGWFTRQKRLMRLCIDNNKKHMKYPKTRYCTLITLPIRLYMTPVIDAVAWKLTRNS